MSYPAQLISDFLRYYSEFGLGAAFRVFLNNRSAGSLKSVQVKGYDQPFYYRQATTDLALLRMIVGRQSVYKTPDPLKLIVDAGANVGYVSVFYAKHFPGAEVYAIEMETSNYEMLLKNCSGYPDIKPIKAALWNHSNGISFSSKSDTDSYSVVDNKTPDQKAASVTLLDILMSAKKDVIDLLKLDIEGAEVEIFDWMRETNLQPRVLMVELHERFRPGCTKALENYLKGRKFVRSMIHEYDIVEFS
jgi:FkbM family methyltransferase